MNNITNAQAQLIMTGQDYLDWKATFATGDFYNQTPLDEVRWIIIDNITMDTIVDEVHSLINDIVDSLDFYYSQPGEYKVKTYLQYLSKYQDSVEQIFWVGPQEEAFLDFESTGDSLYIYASDNMSYEIDSVHWIVYQDDYPYVEYANADSVIGFPYDTNSTYFVQCYIFHYDGNNIVCAYGDSNYYEVAQECNLEVYYTVTNATQGNCDGSISLIINGGTGNYYIDWSTGDYDIPYLNYLCPGVYSATVYDGNIDNCQVNVSNIYVLEDTAQSTNYVDTIIDVVDTCLPNFNVDTFFLSQFTFLNSDTFEISWYFVIGPDTFEFSQIYPYEGEGYYWLMLGFMCDFNKAVTSYGRSVYVYPTVTNNNFIALNDIKLYPNPAKEYTRLSFTSEQNTTAELSVYDVNGKKVINKNITIVSGKNIININTKALPEGLYFVKINNDRILHYTTKFVK